jgi:hypothetical protein
MIKDTEMHGKGAEVHREEEERKISLSLCVSL